jgi:hypothetical protein
MVALLALADEPRTEPLAEASASIPEICGVCGKPATPLVYCMACKRPLCVAHTKIDVIKSEGWVSCPAHTGGRKQ